VKAKIDFELKPFITPNFVESKEGYPISVEDLDADILEQLCDQFRRDVFAKAGYLVRHRPLAMELPDWRVSAMNTKASVWFSDAKEFRQLCGDAQSQASQESAQEFSAQMMLAANKHGLETYLSEKQLSWLCKIADWEVPKRVAS
jgi:hypothetical protein